MSWWTHPRPTGDEEEESPQPTPWRAGAALTPASEARRVALEAWDDELTKNEIKGKPPPDVAARRAQTRAFLLRVANLGLFALAVIGAAAGVAVGWMHIVGDPVADAHAYYEAAARLNAGQPLYPAGLDPNENHIYLYPPLLAVLLRPLALLPFEWFALVWELVVVGSFALLLQRLGVRRRSTWLAVGMLGVPIAWALTIAQAHVPMTLLIAIGQPWAIALAANLKLFPALIFLYWIGRRDFESAAAFLVWGALLVLAQVLLEPNGSFAFFENVGFGQVGENGVLRNFSPFTISPLAWVALLFVGCALTLVAARTRWGWAVAVTFATLAPPHLLVYMLMGLLAGVRRPRDPGEVDPDDLSDPAAVYRRATR
jgi:hypothetical protein